MSKASDIGSDSLAPAIDVDTILDIHRDKDGYVGFVRKPDPTKAPRLDKHGKPYTFENLFSLKVDDLKSMFPAIREYLTHDSYFTVNAYYRAAPWDNSQTGLPDVWRKEKHLKSLTACYADIDSGRPGSEEPGGTLDWRQAQHEAEHLADRGLIPQPSIIARSGRGVYLFWLLKDETNPDKLPHAWPEKIQLYKDINKALIERLRSSLPADVRATDAARVLRTPGSIHRKALKRVKYVIQVAEDGHGFTYTLPELAEFLQVPALEGDLPEATRKLAAKSAKYRKVKNPGSVPLRSHGTIKLNALRSQDLLTIEQYRRGFIKRGQKYADNHGSPGRRSILTLYANFLRGSQVSQDEATKALESMAANMKPAYPSDSPEDDPHISDIVAKEYEGTERRRWTNKKLCRMLGITPEIANELDLKTIIPDELKLRRDLERPTQADLITERRRWLQEYILKNPGIKLTASKVVALSNLSPHTWNNRQTANQDLNAIGYKQWHRRKKRTK